MILTNLRQEKKSLKLFEVKGMLTK